jgi:hypothetical protein
VPSTLVVWIGGRGCCACTAPAIAKAVRTQGTSLKAIGGMAFLLLCERASRARPKGTFAVTLPRRRRAVSEPVDIHCRALKYFNMLRRCGSIREAARQRRPSGAGGKRLDSGSRERKENPMIDAPAPER